MTHFEGFVYSSGTSISSIIKLSAVNKMSLFLYLIAFIATERIHNVTVPWRCEGLHSDTVSRTKETCSDESTILNYIHCIIVHRHRPCLEYRWIFAVSNCVAAQSKS